LKHNKKFYWQLQKCAWNTGKKKNTS